jgi:hypothetical protein
MPGRNPIRDLLHEQMGIDAFALDGDQAEPKEVWQERKRVVFVVPPPKP